MNASKFINRNILKKILWGLMRFLIITAGGALLVYISLLFVAYIDRVNNDLQEFVKTTNINKKEIGKIVNACINNYKEVKNSFVYEIYCDALDDQSSAKNIIKSLKTVVGTTFVIGLFLLLKIVFDYVGISFKEFEKRLLGDSNNNSSEKIKFSHDENKSPLSKAFGENVLNTIMVTTTISIAISIAISVQIPALNIIGGGNGKSETENKLSSEQLKEIADDIKTDVNLVKKPELDQYFRKNNNSETIESVVDNAIKQQIAEKKIVFPGQKIIINPAP